MDRVTCGKHANPRTCLPWLINNNPSRENWFPSPSIEIIITVHMYRIWVGLFPLIKWSFYWISWNCKQGLKPVSIIFGTCIYKHVYTTHTRCRFRNVSKKRKEWGNFFEITYFDSYSKHVYHSQKLNTQRTVSLWFILSDIFVIVVCFALLYSSLLHLKIQTEIAPRPSSMHASRYFFFNCTVHLTLWTQPKEPNRTWMEQTYTLVVVRWKLILPRYVYNNENEGIF